MWRYVQSVTDIDLASARLCVARIHERWGSFQDARRRHLGGVCADGTLAEKVAENILCELFTGVLDWTTEQVRLQEQRVDITLSRGGLKYLIVEAKRPGSFDGRGSILRALVQARGYAMELKVSRVAVSDGCVFEAYDLVPKGLRPRAIVHLADREPAEELWWLSTRGIYRKPPATATVANSDLAGDTLLHPKVPSAGPLLRARRRPGPAGHLEAPLPACRRLGGREAAAESDRCGNPGLSQ